MKQPPSMTFMMKYRQKQQFEYDVRDTYCGGPGRRIIVRLGWFRRWSDSILLNGCGIGCAMMLGNFIAMRFIRNVNKKLYQKMVAGIMIAVSLWLIVSQII